MMDSERRAYMLDAADSIVHRLEGWAKAYPTDIFSEVKQAEIDWLHETKPGLIDRISASMGRHMAGCIQEDIAKLRQLISALEQREAGSKGLEAVEAVARALWEAEHTPHIDTSWDTVCELYSATKNQYLTLARAALAAAPRDVSEANIAARVEYFRQWWFANMPPGTVVSNPAWWFNRIAVRFENDPSLFAAAPSGEGEHG